MSGWRRAAVLAVVVVGAGFIAGRELGRRARTSSEREPHSQWRAVTIFCSPEEVMPGGQRPAPVAALGDQVELEVRPAPGGRGTELRIRLRRQEPSGIGGTVSRLWGNDPRQRVRVALREAKQLLEVGELLRVDPAPHGVRPSTPAGKVIEFAAKRAAGEGVL